jgi:hypothetical protein
MLRGTAIEGLWATPRTALGATLNLHGTESDHTHEVERLRLENQRLRSLVSDLTSTASKTTASLPTSVPKADTDSPGAVKFVDNFTTASARAAEVEAVLGRINDKTLLFSPPQSGQISQFQRGSTLHAINEIGDLVDGAPSTGGVFVLVNPHGINTMTPSPTVMPLRALYDDATRAAHDGAALTHGELRARVRDFAAGSDVQVFASEGMLAVPCQVYTGSVLLYGRLGITFRGHTIKTIGTSDNPTQPGFTAV